MRQIDEKSRDLAGYGYFLTGAHWTPRRRRAETSSVVTATLYLVEWNSMLYLVCGSKRYIFSGTVPLLAWISETRSLRNLSVSIGVVMLMEKAFSIVSLTLPRSIIFFTLNA